MVVTATIVPKAIVVVVSRRAARLHLRGDLPQVVGQAVAGASKRKTSYRRSKRRRLIAANRAAIAAAEVELSHTRIVSPVTGRVGLRYVDPGNLVRTNDATGLVTVTQLAPIAVVFALPQEALPRVQAVLASDVPAVVRVRERAGGTLLAEGKEEREIDGVMTLAGY